MARDESGGLGACDLSVVIVNWNTCEELEGCLRSLEGGGLDRTETIVVDNASSDKSVDMVRRKFASVQLIQNAANLGFARAANQGIAASSGKYVLLLNPDTVTALGSLSKLVEFGNDNPKVGIFGPKILYPDGSLQYSCRRFPTLQAGLFRNSILGRFFPRNAYTRDYLMVEWDHGETRDVDWVSGAAAVIRRELLEDIGLLDERFFMYCEDVDIAYRAKQQGWRVAYYPETEVIHARAKSSDKDPNRMIVEFHKSMHRFFRKHYARDASVFVRLLVPVGLIMRASFFVGRNYFNYTKWVLTHPRAAQRTRAQREVDGCES